jgi:hypothetical protein
MDTDMANLVCDQQGALARFPDILGEDRAALVVENRARPFQSGIARGKPRKIQFQVRQSCPHEIHRRLQRARFSGDRDVESGCSFANRLERVHELVPKRQQAAPLLFA